MQFVFRPLALAALPAVLLALPARSADDPPLETVVVTASRIPQPIDRAKFGSTSIGSGTKIDNLVQIGHNCRIGRSCIICGQVGLSGSVTLGDGVQLAGRVGVTDNIHIGAMARVGASAGVMNDIPSGQTWLGAPAMPVKEAARNMALFRRLSQIMKKVKVDGA